MSLAEEHISIPTTVLQTPGLSLHLIPDNTETILLPSAKDNAPILDFNNQDSKIQNILADSYPQGTSTPQPRTSPYLITNDDATDVILSTTGPTDDFDTFTNPFGPSTVFTLHLKKNHPTLSLNFIEHSDTSRIKLQLYSPSTPVAHVPRW